MKAPKRMNSNKPKPRLDVAPSEQPNTLQTLASERYLDTKQAAAFLNFHPDRLKKWRQRDMGPQFVRHESGAIAYPVTALMQYLDACTVKPARKKRGRKA